MRSCLQVGPFQTPQFISQFEWLDVPIEQKQYQGLQAVPYRILKKALAVCIVTEASKCAINFASYRNLKLRYLRLEA